MVHVIRRGGFSLLLIAWLSGAVVAPARGGLVTWEFGGEIQKVRDDNDGLGGAVASRSGGGKQRGTVELPGPPVQYEFPVLRVDLKTGRCRSPFIKLRAVAMVSEPDMARLAEVETQVVDAFQAFLRDLERQDLVGKAGTDKLRQGFLSILNTAMEPAKARNVLFREILLQ